MVLLDQEVIDSPTFILWSQVSPNRPKGILDFLRVEMSESIDITLIKKVTEGFSLLRGVTRDLLFAFRIINIDFLVGYV